MNDVKQDAPFWDGLFEDYWFVSLEFARMHPSTPADVDRWMLIPVSRKADKGITGVKQLIEHSLDRDTKLLYFPVAVIVAAQMTAPQPGQQGPRLRVTPMRYDNVYVHLDSISHIFRVDETELTYSLQAVKIIQGSMSKIERPGPTLISP